MSPSLCRAFLFLSFLFTFVATASPPDRYALSVTELRNIKGGKCGRINQKWVPVKPRAGGTVEPLKSMIIKLKKSYKSARGLKRRALFAKISKLEKTFNKQRKLCKKAGAKDPYVAVNNKVKVKYIEGSIDPRTSELILWFDVWSTEKNQEQQFYVTTLKNSSGDFVKSTYYIKPDGTRSFQRFGFYDFWYTQPLSLIDPVRIGIVFPQMLPVSEVREISIPVLNHKTPIEFDSLPLTRTPSLFADPYTRTGELDEVVTLQEASFNPGASEIAVKVKFSAKRSFDFRHIGYPILSSIVTQTGEKKYLSAVVLPDGTRNALSSPIPFAVGEGKTLELIFPVSGQQGAKISTIELWYGAEPLQFIEVPLPFSR